MTVGELIEELKKYPPDMLVGINFDPFDDIEVHKSIWTHTNYPYDKPDVEFVLIE